MGRTARVAASTSTGLDRLGAARPPRTRGRVGSVSAQRSWLASGRLHPRRAVDLCAALAAHASAHRCRHRVRLPWGERGGAAARRRLLGDALRHGLATDSSVRSLPLGLWSRVHDRSGRDDARSCAERIRRGQQHCRGHRRLRLLAVPRSRWTGGAVPTCVPRPRVRPSEIARARAACPRAARHGRSPRLSHHHSGAGGAHRGVDRSRHGGPRAAGHRRGGVAHAHRNAHHGGCVARWRDGRTGAAAWGRRHHQAGSSHGRLAAHRRATDRRTRRHSTLGGGSGVPDGAGVDHERCAPRTSRHPHRGVGHRRRRRHPLDRAGRWRPEPFSGRLDWLRISGHVRACQVARRHVAGRSQ